MHLMNQYHIGPLRVTNLDTEQGHTTRKNIMSSGLIFDGKDITKK